MAGLSKTFMIIGGIFILVGIAIHFSGKLPWIGKLPGDILIKKENFTFYFPITTSIIVSAILSLIFVFIKHR